MGGSLPSFWLVLSADCATVFFSITSWRAASTSTAFENELVGFLAHHPGNLVYWRVDDRIRVDSKLGPSAGVAIYLGPAAAVRQVYQVYALNRRVILHAVHHP